MMEAYEILHMYENPLQRSLQVGDTSIEHSLG